MKKLIAFLVSAITGMSSLHAWTITDNEGHPMQYVSANIFKRNFCTMTDSTGRFALPDGILANETIWLSAPGFNNHGIRYSDLMADTTQAIALEQSVDFRPETMARTEKQRNRKAGKKHSSGLVTGMIDGSDEYMCAGYEFHAKKGKTLWLDKVGFYIDAAKSDLEHMKIRVSVYDMSGVKKAPSSEFTDAFSAPVALFDFDKNNIEDNKFTYSLPASIKLPKDAMVAVEFVEPLGSQKFFFKSNVIGGTQAWTKSIHPGEWDKFPMALPFFIDCIETK